MFLKIAGLVFCALNASGALAVSITNTSHDSSNDFGVGVDFSGPVGLSLYHNVNAGNFVQGAVAYANGGNYAFTADDTFASHGVFSGAPTLTPFWGIGGIVLQEQTT